MVMTFSPPVAPSPESDKEVTPRILRADFGDGYAQRSGDGINTMRQVRNLAWNVLTFADADTIEAFFAARSGVESFYWTAPDEASPRRWLCSTWRRGYVSGNMASLTATFTEVFDL